MKQIIIDKVLSADGTTDWDATYNVLVAAFNNAKAAEKEDFDTVAVDITEFLLTAPGLKTIPTNALVRALWEQKIERGDLKGKTHEEKQALYDRLAEVVPEYVKGNPDMFHMGRKTGIAIRYVMGEQAKDAKGDAVFDDNGDPTQAYRHSAEEWAKLTAVKEKAGANGAASTASPNAGTAAPAN